MESVMKHDAHLAHILRCGIQFEVFYWRAMIDGPLGSCANTSHTLNEAQDKAMDTHEMEALATLMKAIHTMMNRSAVAGTG